MVEPRPRLTGVYVHLPFCDVKCAYCDFYSLANRHVDEAFWKRYLDRLLEDLNSQYDRLVEDTPRPVLASVFFGGGTPSRAPGFIFESVIAAVVKIFPERLTKIEITAEGNPESLTEAVLQSWHGAGVNRVSVGLQSLDEPVLKYLGRLYSPEAYRKVLGRVRAAGFENFNADFITGVPGQSVGSTLRDVDFALAEGASHASVYQLTIEPGTLLKQRIETKMVSRPSDDEQVKQMDAAVSHLEERGLHRYEISNFARAGKTCLHNLIYWTGRPYMGLGVAAHGFTGRRRFFHARSLEKYLAGEGLTQDPDVSSRDQLMNFLRLKQPFHKSRVLSLFTASDARTKAEQILHAAVEKHWLLARGASFTLTHMGLKYTDSLIADLWNI
jgi:oxygen-independent coproporphyrinogen-3 oxidase